MARPDGTAPPARRVMSIYAVVKEPITRDPWRGKRQGGDEPRAAGVRRKSICGSLQECRRKQDIRVSESP
jgi:hypothetical protein